MSASRTCPAFTFSGPALRGLLPAEPRRPMKHIFFSLVACFLLLAPAASAFSPDKEFERDREALEVLQRDAFRYMWEDADPDSGMAYEANFDWEVRPVAVGGTGFGIAALVVGADRGWISREQAVRRLMKIGLFLRDKTPRKDLHGAFPHWLNGSTGAVISFGERDDDADLVETSLLMQGLLIARAYFNGPGVEETLRALITELWEGVDWNWFTKGEENGLYWHWSRKHGFSASLKILGYNECLITYVLAMASPTHPISRKAYDYWTSGKGYKPKDVYGYRIEASLRNAGPLFLAHYSFIGLDPRQLADAYVPSGYFVRNVKHALSNRAYCLQNAPAENRYSEDFWGLTASQIKGGYAANEPAKDSGTVAPTAALSSMPYTPQYSMQVLHTLRGKLREKVWGKNGPYDAISLRDAWVSELYLAIDQLPIVCMVENYRTGLLWNLLMADPDVRAGLQGAGLAEPRLEEGFPEAVVTMKKEGKAYVPDAYAARRHPDSGQYKVPYWTAEPGPVEFTLFDPDGKAVLRLEQRARKGRNTLCFNQFRKTDGEALSLTMRTKEGKEYSLPVRLY